MHPPLEQRPVQPLARRRPQHQQLGAQPPVQRPLVRDVEVVERARVAPQVRRQVPRLALGLRQLPVRRQDAATDGVAVRAVAVLAPPAAQRRRSRRSAS